MADIVSKAPVRRHARARFCPPPFSHARAPRASERKNTNSCAPGLSRGLPGSPTDHPPARPSVRRRSFATASSSTAPERRRTSATSRSKTASSRMSASACKSREICSCFVFSWSFLTGSFCFPARSRAPARWTRPASTSPRAYSRAIHRCLCGAVKDDDSWSQKLLNYLFHSVV